MRRRELWSDANRVAIQSSNLIPFTNYVIPIELKPKVFTSNPPAAAIVRLNDFNRFGPLANWEKTIRLISDRLRMVNCDRQIDEKTVQWSIWLEICCANRSINYSVYTWRERVREGFIAVIVRTRLQIRRIYRSPCLSARSDKRLDITAIARLGERSFSLIKFLSLSFYDDRWMTSIVSRSNCLVQFYDFWSNSNILNFGFSSTKMYLPT